MRFTDLQIWLAPLRLRHFQLSTLHFQLSRHCERSEAIQTNDTKRPLDCFTACFVPRNSSPFAMTFHARHFDRSVRGTSTRSGEICCKTQAVWERLRGIAGDSSTALRFARNDGGGALRSARNDGDN
jgi:hypothetical protein